MQKRLKQLFSLENIAVILLISLGFGLRVWRLSELFHFTYDEEVFAFIGKRMWVNHHIPLIGGVTPMHVHVAPYFYWFSGFFLGLFKFNPVGWGIIAGIVAVLTMFILYLTAKKMFGWSIAIISLLLYSFSFYQNIFDRHYWGLVFDGLVSLATIFSLFNILKGKQHYFLVLCGILAYGIHTDLSTLVLVLLTVLVFIFYRPSLSRRIYLAGIGIFLVSFFPLIIFDLKHNFANSRGFMQYAAEVKTGKKGVVYQTPLKTMLYIPRTLGRLLYVASDTDLAKQYSYCPKYAIGRLEAVSPFVVVLVILLFIGATWFSLTKLPESDRIGLRLILLLFGTTLAGVLIYGILFRGDLFDHYLASLFPLFFILVAYLLVRILNHYRYFLYGVLIIFITLNLHLLVFAKHSYGFADKEKGVKWAIATLGDHDFSLDVLSSCFRYNGYRYLFYLYGKEPVKSYVDANFTHLFDKPPALVHPPYLVVITNPDFIETDIYFQKLSRYRQKLIAESSFGNIGVLIIDNRDLDFIGDF